MGKAHFLLAPCTARGLLYFPCTARGLLYFVNTESLPDICLGVFVPRLALWVYPGVYLPRRFTAFLFSRRRSGDAPRSTVNTSPKFLRKLGLLLASAKF